MRKRSTTLQELIARAPMRRGARLGAGGAATTCVVTLHRNQGIFESYCLKEFGSDATRETLVRELAVLSRLKHPGIATLHDYVAAGTLLEDGVPLEHPSLLFELIDGVSLAELLRHVPEHRLPPEQVIEIALALADACDYAHQFVVHRDISAANVMLSCAGAVKLLDFGIASVRLPGEPRTKTICGTPSYMSPEQARGERPVDGRSDLFSVGVLLYELLSGKRPFDGHNAHETMYRADHGIRVSLAERAPQTPAPLMAIVDRLLHRDPDDRFANARALFEALAAIAPARTTRYELAATATRVRDILRPATPQAEPKTVRALQQAPQAPQQAADPPAAANRLQRHKWPLIGLTTASLALVGMLIRQEPATAATQKAEPTFETASAPATAPSNDPAPDDSPSLPAAPPPVAQQDADATTIGADQPRAERPEPVTPPGRRLRPRSATITVGSRPNITQVWLDGKLLGDSPRTTTVAPGKHIVGAGDGRPLATREVDLKAGEKTVEIFR